MSRRRNKRHNNSVPNDGKQGMKRLKLFTEFGFPLQLGYQTILQIKPDKKFPMITHIKTSMRDTKTGGQMWFHVKKNYAEVLDMYYQVKKNLNGR